MDYIFFKYDPEEDQWEIFWTRLAPYCADPTYLVMFKQHEEDTIFETVTTLILFVNVTVPTCSVIEITVTPVFLGILYEPTTIIRHAGK